MFLQTKLSLFHGFVDTIQWVELDSIIKEALGELDVTQPGCFVPSNYLSSFDFEIITQNAHKLLDSQLQALPNFSDFQDELPKSSKGPDYCIILLEPRENWIALYEAMLLPYFIEEGETWEFYQGHQGEFPTTEDLSTLKGIIVSGAIEVCFSNIPTTHNPI